MGSSPINASRTKLLLAVLDTLSDLSRLGAFEWIQAGSRFLQKALMDKDPNFSLVFPELLANVDQLATDMFGNYLIQVTNLKSPHACGPLECTRMDYPSSTPEYLSTPEYSRELRPTWSGAACPYVLRVRRGRPS